MTYGVWRMVFIIIIWMYGYGCDDGDDATAVYVNNNLMGMYIILII